MEEFEVRLRAEQEAANWDEIGDDAQHTMLRNRMLKSAGGGNSDYGTLTTSLKINKRTHRRLRSKLKFRFVPRPDMVSGLCGLLEML